MYYIFLENFKQKKFLFLLTFFSTIVYNISKKTLRLLLRNVVQERLAKNNLTILRGVSRCHLAQDKIEKLFTKVGSRNASYFY